MFRHCLWSERCRLNKLLMFKNYFKIAFRNLLRTKTFSFINITRLVMGTGYHACKATLMNPVKSLKAE